MNPLRDRRLWVAILLAAAGVAAHGAADGAWWGAFGAFAVGFALVLAYYAGRRA